MVAKISHNLQTTPNHQSVKDYHLECRMHGESGGFLAIFDLKISMYKPKFSFGKNLWR